jgi:hypothetical protein
VDAGSEQAAEAVAGSSPELPASPR